jgi:Txe/YoeB family toxin of Txe-Axe toxin-antitoxin module
MGFLEYAWSIFFEKDWMKTKLLLSRKLQRPQLFRDGIGFVAIFPEPTVKSSSEGEETISLMGYNFPSDALGKKQLVNLFRASVFHLSSHVLTSNFDDYEEWRRGKNLRLVKFIISLIEDVKANAYVFSKHPDKLADLAFADALALKRIRRIDRILNPATKTMAGLLIKANTGSTEIKSKKELMTINHLAELLAQLKEKSLLSFADNKMELKNEKIEIANKIYDAIETCGPITEVSSFPHTEEIGSSTIFASSHFVDSDITTDDSFNKCLEFLGGTRPQYENSSSQRIAENETSQVFETWKHKKDKEDRMLAKYQNLLSSTRFKSVEFPEQDYTESLRVRSRSKSEGHRLIESLLVARDAIDEDPRKMYGVLDLQEIIQVVASKSPRMDVFMLDEYLSKSYSWVVLLDASRSMKGIKDFALELFLILGDVANELLLDSGSWALYAFNDRFLVIKDPKERYNVNVKSRIGGINFEGFTYMPDALRIAGHIIRARNENMRLITIISDGWPYGYEDIDVELKNTLTTLNGGNISVVGVGAKSRRMEFFFKSNCPVYTLRDLTKRFSNLYFEASRIAAES